jgi:hypothetical protein
MAGHQMSPPLPRETKRSLEIHPYIMEYHLVAVAETHRYILLSETDNAFSLSLAVWGTCLLPRLHPPTLLDFSLTSFNAKSPLYM